MNQDWTRVFPILGKKTYLASHSLGAVPAAARGALGEYVDAWADQGIQAWDGPWWDAVADFCGRIERLLGASAKSVAPMPNATRAMAAVASALDYSGKRNTIVLSDLEFTTSYPFWRAQERLGARIRIVESADGVEVPADSLIEAIDERTLLVQTCHVYFRSGAVQDLARITRAAHEKGAMMLADGYQAVGTVPVDVRGLDVDFYVGGCHKYLCGGPGAGFLYVRPDLAGTLQPRLTGWFGLKDPFAYRRDLRGADLAPGVFRFLDGTPNVPALFAAREGLRVIEQVGVDAIRRASLSRTAQIMGRCDELGLAIRTPRDDERRGGMVCVDFEGAQRATQRLVDQGVIVDWRPDCGMRVSPHFYNSAQDLARFFETLQPLALRA